MTFQGWLPITTRNRVALLFAFVGLVLFVVWNCLPIIVFRQLGIQTNSYGACLVLPTIFSEDSYAAFRGVPNLENLLWAISSLAIALCGLVTIFIVPFWELIHASATVRRCLLISMVSGGAAVTITLCRNAAHYASANYSIIPLLATISANMFTISGALRNELALRELRNRPQPE